MVTGAGGSIGSELCRQICAFGPECLLLVERAENALFEIHQELIRNFPDLALKPVLADICDRKRIDQVLSDEQPTVIFHAAAHKHVPMMELNPGEAVKNNVFGTRTLAELADLHHVETFVMISTDKAVNPSSIMGTSKRLAEVFLQAFSGRSETRFVTVRFGNVLGSAGSVIPIFKAQLARGGPITVTHAEMERYFMTIPEAVQLVLQAATMGEGGEIFILNMGEPVKIIDLARDLIRLSGFQEPDIEIRITGMRPGEKLREELSKAEEQLNNTGHPKIYVGRAPAQDYRSVRNGLWQLAEAMEAGDAESVPLLLQKLVPEYRPASSGAQTDSASFEVAPVSAETRSGKTLRRAVS